VGRGDRPGGAHPPRTHGWPLQRGVQPGRPPHRLRQLRPDGADLGWDARDTGMGGGTPGPGGPAVAGPATPGGRGLRTAGAMVRRRLAPEPTPGPEPGRRRPPRPPRRRASPVRSRAETKTRARAAGRRLREVRVLPWSGEAPRARGSPTASDVE